MRPPVYSGRRLGQTGHALGRSRTRRRQNSAGSDRQRLQQTTLPCWRDSRPSSALNRWHWFREAKPTYNHSRVRANGPYLPGSPLLPRLLAPRTQSGVHVWRHFRTGSRLNIGLINQPRTDLANAFLSQELVKNLNFRRAHLATILEPALKH